MESYHETSVVTSDTNPYAYTVIPPVGALLDIICRNRSVGGCFRPGNRWLATEMGYASASQIPYLLSQLACDGWIRYDSETGVITLWRDPRAPRGDQAIRSPDRSVAQIADDDFDDDSQVIDPIDRDMPQQDAEYETDQSRRSIPQRMEDSCLAAADHDSDSAAARSKIPCTADSISPPDHPAALLLAEFGADPAIIADALSVRPDLAPEQIRGSWAHFEPRIRAGLCTSGAFFSAIRRGQLHTAPPDPTRPLDPADYAGDRLYRLGSDMSGLAAPPIGRQPLDAEPMHANAGHAPTPSACIAPVSAVAPPPEAESIRDHAARLLPPPTADTLKNHTRDWLFLQGRLGARDSDEAALAALDSYRRAVRR